MADVDRIRIDKWLWQARFCKTRTLAAGTVSSGRVRINGDRTQKPGRMVGPGDVLTLRLRAGVRVVRVVQCGTRRGPAPEARTLYEEVSDADDVPQSSSQEE